MTNEEAKRLAVNGLVECDTCGWVRPRIERVRYDHYGMAGSSERIEYCPKCGREIAR